MSSLKQKAISGSIWVIIGFGTSQFLRLINNLILTRLLVPELFGLMALVNTFIMGLNLFSDVGIKPSIVRSERGEDPVFLNTAWTLQVVRGCGIWICSLIIAFPLARFYDEPKLMWLIPIVGLCSLISGFNSTSLAVLNRNIKTKQVILIRLVTQTITLSTMITWAYFQPTIWALVIGNFVSKMVELYWSHRISSIHHHLLWDKEAIKELISFGRWIFISTAMTFLASQSDRLILGKLFSLDMLGVYTVALTFASIPRNIIGKLNNLILMPLFSKKINLPRQEFKEKILHQRQYLLIILAIFVALMFCFGDILIQLLYTQTYKDASWMMPILILGLWPLILNDSIDRLLYVIGKPQYNAIGTCIKFLYMYFLLPFVLTTKGIFRGLIVIAFNDIPIYVITNYGLWKEKFCVIKQDIISSIILILFISILIILRYYYNNDFPILSYI